MLHITDIIKGKPFLSFPCLSPFLFLPFLPPNSNIFNAQIVSHLLPLCTRHSFISLCLSHSLSFSFSHSLFLIPSLSVSHPRTFSLFLSLSITSSLSVSFFHPLYLSPSFSHSLPLSLSLPTSRTVYCTIVPNSLCRDVFTVIAKSA